MLLAGALSIDPFAEERRRMDEFLRPIRQQQEQLERLLAACRFPEYGSAGLHFAPLRDHADMLASFALPRNLESELAAFQALAAPAGQTLSAIHSAIDMHSGWISDAFVLSQIDTLAQTEIARAAASLSLLTGTQNALLDAARWDQVRPLSESLNDILVIGRTQWALHETSAPTTTERRGHVIRASEWALQRIAQATPDDPTIISPRQARRQAGAVARTLHAHSKAPVATPLAPRPDLFPESIELFRTIASVARVAETRHRKPLAGGYAGWLLECAMDTIDPARLPSDRFDGLVGFLFDFFVDSVDKSEPALKKARPLFFSGAVRDLRHTHASHHPEARMAPARVAENLAKREQRLREVCGRVPVTQIEWESAILALLRHAGAAAIEFRDTLEQ